MLAPEHDAGEIDGQHPIPVIELRILDRLPEHDPGIVDEDVEPPEPAEHERHQGYPVLLVGHVVLNEQRARLIGQGLPPRLLAIGDDYRRAFILEQTHASLPDPLSTAGDDSHLALQPIRHRYSSNKKTARLLRSARHKSWPC